MAYCESRNKETRAAPGRGYGLAGTTDRLPVVAVPNWRMKPNGPKL